MMTVTVAGGTMTLTGPAELLQRPSDGEIRARIAATVWRTAFDRVHVEGLHRLGYIETRFQLEYSCSEQGIGANLHGFALKHGVRVSANPRPRGGRSR
jgi:hypothetical protein